MAPKEWREVARDAKQVESISDGTYNISNRLKVNHYKCYVKENYHPIISSKVFLLALNSCDFF